MQRISIQRILLVGVFLALVGAGFFAAYFLKTRDVSAVQTASAKSAQKSSAPSSSGKTSESLPAGLEVNVSGPNQGYDIALDEIYTKTAEGVETIRPIPLQRNFEELREYVRNEENRTSDRVEPLLYESGRPRSSASRHVLTRKVLVKLDQPGQSLSIPGSLKVELPDYAPGYAIVTLADVGESVSASENIARMRGVQSAEPMLASWKTPRSVPNDPLFANQWHLRNTGQGGGLAGTDVNVQNLWGTFGGAGYRGAGIRIAIVDDGLETAHPDLAANVDTDNDYDWDDATPLDPNPGTGNPHGTCCAGVAAARGNNSLGVSGAAPEATLVGFRLIAASVDDSQEAEAFTRSSDIIQIKSNSWGPEDDAATLEGPGPLALAAFQTATTSGRGNKGTIFVFACGNGRDVGDYANFDAYDSSRFVVAVAALDNFGNQAYYSESGSNVLVTAPSSGDTGTLSITTVDRTSTKGYNTASGVAGNYASDFGGTSSAAPLVSGVCALILQKNPNLGWRDLQEILVRSSTKVQPTDTDWVTNGAGFKFNHKFGAGLINAEAAANMGTGWTNLKPESSTELTNTTVGTIPDNNATGASRTFDFSAANFRVEHVEITTKVTHTRRGDLECVLTSPSGTQSVLAIPRTPDATSVTNEVFTFTTVHHWGEKANGTWTVRVADRASSKTGSLISVKVKLLGVDYGSTGKENWRYSTFTAAELSNPAISGDAADPDSDGYTNLSEYAMGTSPKSASQTPALIVGTASGNLTLGYQKLRSDVTYAVETSTTMASDSWTTTGVNQGSGTSPVASIPMGSDPKRFLRLKITAP